MSAWAWTDRIYYLAARDTLVHLERWRDGSYFLFVLRELGHESGHWQWVATANTETAGELYDLLRLLDPVLLFQEEL